MDRRHRASPSDPRDVGLDDFLEALLADTTLELATALGLVRFLTLLSLHDGVLDEVERRLATTWESVLAMRRLLEDERLGHRPEREL
jgi:hypothetical protein